MKKFIVLYMAPAASMKAMMEASSPEQQKEGMDEWMKWMQKYANNFIDQGSPAGKNTRVTANGSKEVSNDVGGYSIMQADSKEDLITILQDNPHFKMDDAYIEVMDYVEM